MSESVLSMGENEKICHRECMRYSFGSCGMFSKRFAGSRERRSKIGLENPDVITAGRHGNLRHVQFVRVGMPIFLTIFFSETHAEHIRNDREK